MNPPTIGHQKLIDKVRNTASNVNGKGFIFLSHKQNNKTDPLSFTDKLGYLQSQYQDPNLEFGNIEANTIIKALQKMQDQGRTKIIMVAGSDRVAEFEKLSNIANAGINIATSLTNPKVLTNPPLFSIVATLGAAQLAAIIGTPIPKNATGGLVGGRRHSQGGTMIEAEQGEYVVSRAGVESIGVEALNRINAGGGSAVNITFSGNVMSKDFIEDEAIPQIKEAIRRGADIGVG